MLLAVTDSAPRPTPCPACRALPGATQSYGHASLVAQGSAWRSIGPAGFLQKESVFLSRCATCGCRWCFGLESPADPPHWFPDASDR